MFLGKLDGSLAHYISIIICCVILCTEALDKDGWDQHDSLILYLFGRASHDTHIGAPLILDHGTILLDHALT
jgi:hypothetical protein